MRIKESWGFGADLLDKLIFIVFSIIPRFAIIILFIIYIYNDEDSFFQSSFVMILISFMVFYFFPPFMTVITITKKTEDRDRDTLTLLKLYKASQDDKNGRGIYEVDGCFLIKSYYGKASKYAQMLIDKYSLKKPDYDFLRHRYRKKDFKEAYYFYLEEVSRTLIKNRYGIDAAFGLDVRHRNFWDLKHHYNN